MRKNTCVVFVLIGIFLLWGAANTSAVDPEEMGEKYEAYWHSMAGLDTLTSGINLVCTWWEQLWDCHNKYHIVAVHDHDGNGMLNPSDKIQADCRESWGNPHPEEYGRRWYHVKMVTITLTLTSDNDTMWVEFENGFSKFDSAYIDSAILPPVVCDTLHAIWPESMFCKRYHLNSWIDGQPEEDPGHDTLSTCDTIGIKNVETGVVTSWHVIDVAIDIYVTSTSPPEIPTMTQWGLIVLVALLIISTVFVLLKRRRAVIRA